MPGKLLSLTSRRKSDNNPTPELQVISFDSVTSGLPPKLEDTPGSGTSQGSTPTRSKITLPGVDAAKSTSSLKLGGTSPRPSSVESSRRSSSRATQPTVASQAARSENLRQDSGTLLLSGDLRRDSGMASSTATMEGSSPFAGDGLAQSVPAIVLQEDSPGSPPKTIVCTPPAQIEGRIHHPDTGSSTKTSNGQFQGITTSIESGELEDIFAADKVSFSKRGSLLWGKDRARAFRESRTKQTATSKVERSISLRENRVPEEDVSQPANGMTADERRQSKRVRSMYEYGDGDALQWLADPNLQAPPEVINEETAEDDAVEASKLEIGSKHSGSTEGVRANRASSSVSIRSKRASMMRKEPWEIAGGIEDWRDVEDVDRYGFIRTKTPASRGSSRLSTPVPPQGPDVPGTSLSPIAEGFLKDSEERPITPTTPNMSHTTLPTGRTPGMLSPNAKNQPSSPSMFSGRSTNSRTSSFRRRSFSRQSRRVAEASNMLNLSLPMGFQAGSDRIDSPRTAASKASRERKREMKWQKMAIPVQRPLSSSKEGQLTVGAGATEYAFDTSDSKLVSRTWKGIPDRWRSAVWRSFLLSSSKEQLGASAPSDAVLVAEFHMLQEQDCADDVQIDMDVPRTIAGHVMFRSRYRGGQRLMFRVLHALSLKFPQTGYVQGMAPLAATLLCYYDEETAFAMGVRMWMLRGLQYLYSPGFEGLMSTLDELESHWLGKSDMKRSLDTLGINAMSYATKWYLTLFNHTLPFSAQLRVWDVFMLLGSPNKAIMAGHKGDVKPDFSVLHAVATALIDGMHDVLVGAEFDNAMSILTSAHGVVVDDVLMSVARKRYRDNMR